MNEKNYTITFLLIFFILYSPIFSKNSSLHGRLIDQNSGDPISNANIYLANTSIGTTTDSKGYFEICDLPQGTFDVIFSHVSYYFRSERYVLKHPYNDIGEIELSPKVHQLETVVVEAEEAELWHDRYEIFHEQFIGTSDNADSTNITDPYNIEFWESDGNLFASSIDPIEIINRSLGYRIIYFLDHFESCSDYTKYSGNAVFSSLTSNNISDKQRWNENRKHIYTGSFRHFLVTLNDAHSFSFNVLDEEYDLIDSVEIERSFTSRNTQRATYSYKIDSLSSIADEYLNDRGFFLYRTFALPWESPAPISDEPISMKELLSPGKISSERYLKFTKYLRVYYIPNYKKEDYTFNFSVRSAKGLQSSFIQLEKDSVMVDIKGRYYDKFGIHTFGKFGQERIADMLPYEYVID